MELTRVPLNDSIFFKRKPPQTVIDPIPSRAPVRTATPAQFAHARFLGVFIHTVGEVSLLRRWVTVQPKSAEMGEEIGSADIPLGLNRSCGKLLVTMPWSLRGSMSEAAMDRAVIACDETNVAKASLESCLDGRKNR